MLVKTGLHTSQFIVGHLAFNNIYPGHAFFFLRSNDSRITSRRVKRCIQHVLWPEMCAKPSTEIAANWQNSAHVLQAAHRSAFTIATYPDEASIGVPLRWAFIASQQHEQQLQMA